MTDQTNQTAAVAEEIPGTEVPIAAAALRPQRQKMNKGLAVILAGIVACMAVSAVGIAVLVLHEKAIHAEQTR